MKKSREHCGNMGVLNNRNSRYSANWLHLSAKMVGMLED
jgi:hypothetical protein